MASLDNEEGLLDLHWDDILIPRILPFLSVKDLFILRAVSKNFSELIDRFLSRNRRLVLDERIYQRLSVAGYQLISSTSTNLRLINLSGSSIRWLRNEVLRPTLFINPHLTHLDLSDCNGLTEEILLDLAACECAKNLKTLCLAGCGWADAAAVTTLLSATGSLQRLDLKGCWGCGDESVATALVAKNPAIKSVCLAKIYGLRDGSVRILAQGARSLKSVNLSECYRLTNTSVFYLTEYCPSLTQLYVRGCRDIDAAGVERLRRRGVEIDVEDATTKLEQKQEKPKMIFLQI